MSDINSILDSKKDLNDTKRNKPIKSSCNFEEHIKSKSREKDLSRPITPRKQDAVGMPNGQTDCNGNVYKKVNLGHQSDVNEENTESRLIKSANSKSSIKSKVMNGKVKCQDTSIDALDNSNVQQKEGGRDSSNKESKSSKTNLKSKNWKSIRDQNIPDLSRINSSAKVRIQCPEQNIKKSNCFEEEISNSNQKHGIVDPSQLSPFKKMTSIDIDKKALLKQKGNFFTNNSLDPKKNNTQDTIQCKETYENIIPSTDLQTIKDLNTDLNTNLNKEIERIDLPDKNFSPYDQQRLITGESIKEQKSMLSIHKRADSGIQFVTNDGSQKSINNFLKGMDKGLFTPIDDNHNKNENFLDFKNNNNCGITTFKVFQDLSTIEIMKPGNNMQVTFLHIKTKKSVANKIDDNKVLDNDILPIVILLFVKIKKGIQRRDQ